MCVGAFRMYKKGRNRQCSRDAVWCNLGCYWMSGYARTIIDNEGGVGYCAKKDAP